MKRFIEAKSNKKYDIIVIGGGITGAAVAYDAAMRGFSVALLEKKDFGGATSAATSKMIHGGLRYLANFEIGLVRESLKERRIMENIAPNFVYPIPNMITNNKQSITNRKYVLKIAMILYDLLSFDKGWTWDKNKKIPLHRTLSKEEVLKLEPNVKKDGLTGASICYDCISIFPERLTLAFIKSAEHHGAEVANYAKVEGFLFNGDKKITGVSVKDILTGKTLQVHGDVVINCGGPWADIILGLASKKDADQHIRRSEGIHIITKKLINDHIVTAITPKGRHFFLIPWRGHSLIGTTDKEYLGTPDEWKVTKESIMELLDEVNSSFGNDTKVAYKDILHVYGGLRPLVEEQTENVYETSRKYEIYDNKKDGLDGLITVEGGKYTTSRNLAEHAINMVEHKLGRSHKKPKTQKYHLYGSEITDIKGYIDRFVRENSGFPENTLDYLARNYGTEASRVLDIARSSKDLAQPLNQDGEMLAEVVYAIRYEMAKTLGDIIFRRTGLGTLGNPGKTVLEKIAKVAARELKWSDSRKKKEIAEATERLKIPIK